MWSPAPASVAIARCSAAMPLAVATAPTPPSSAAMRSSSTAVVGLEMRRIDVAGAFEIEQRRRVIGIGEDVGGGLVDRHGARAGRRIGALAGVQAERVEGGRTRSGHARP